MSQSKESLLSFLFLIISVQSQTIDLTINECTTVETQFSVINGHVGGTVYIEGTTQNFPDCQNTLVGDDTDVFKITFETCGVNYGFLASSNTIDFYVVVTKYPFANIFTDPRFHVRCSFQESTNNVDIQVESVTADKSGTEKKHETDPTADISLCKNTENGTCQSISYSNTVTMGDQLTLRFDLSPQVPNYELRIDECFFEAKDQQTGMSVSTLQLLDIESHCSEYPIFPDFVHSSMMVTSSGGNLLEVPYATTSFTAFIPLTITKALALVDLDLVIGCKVAICFSGSNDCTLPSCGSGRKKREADSTILNNTQIWLYEGFQMQIGDHNNKEVDQVSPNNLIPKESGTSDICLQKHVFWAILLCLMFLVICAAVVTCCSCAIIKRQERRRKRIYDESFSSASFLNSNSVSCSSSLNVKQQQQQHQSHLIPRYVAYAIKPLDNNTLKY